MKLFTKHYLAVVIAAACSPAFAADIEEIVVTASPLGKTTETVNHPVNVMSGESLQNAASSTLGETLNGQLGVSSASFGPGVGLPIIRGQSDNRVKVMQDSVGSMDASAASPDHAITLEPLLANRIEVLRGPAALRYGSGAIGGVVNVLDNRIPDTLPDAIKGGAELRHATVNNERAGVVNLTGALDDVAFYVDGVKRESDDMDIPGYAQKNPANPDETTKGYVANTNSHSNSGTFGASYVGSEGFVGASVSQLDNNYGVPPDGDELVRIDMHQTRYDLKAELNNPFDGFEKISARAGHNDYQHTEMESGVPGTKFTNNAYEGRVELIHNPLGIWKGALGVQAAQSTFAAVGEEAFIPKSDIRSLGLFVVEEASLGQWTYELGARHDQQSIAPENGSSISHGSLNVSGSAAWHFTETQQFSLGIAQSQRAPSVEELLANGPHPATGSYLVGDANLHEETSSNIELGYHLHLPLVQVSANLFYNRINDFIYAQNLDELVGSLKKYQYTQADATFKGAELEVIVPVAEHWSWRVFGDSVRATLDDGGDLPRITPARIGSSVDYALGAWTANLGIAHAAKQNHPGYGETETGSYNRIDGQVSYKFKQRECDYTLFLKAVNLGDAEIRNATSYLRDIAPEAGRSLQAGVRVTF